MNEVTVQRAMVLLSRMHVQMKTAVNAGLFRFPSGSAWLDECAAAFDASQVPAEWPARLLLDIDDLIGQTVRRERMLGSELSAALSTFVYDWQQWEKAKARPESGTQTMLQEVVAVRTALCELVRDLGPRDADGNSAARFNAVATVDIVEMFKTWAAGITKSHGLLLQHVMAGTPTVAVIQTLFSAADKTMAAAVQDGADKAAVLATFFAMREAVRPYNPALADTLVPARTEAATAAKSTPPPPPAPPAGVRATGGTQP